MTTVIEHIENGWEFLLCLDMRNYLYYQPKESQVTVYTNGEPAKPEKVDVPVHVGLHEKQYDQFRSMAPPPEPEPEAAE